MSSLSLTGAFQCSRRALRAGGGGAIVLAYLLLLCWFDSRDLYHRHFFDHGLAVRLYQWARLAFIFWFGWLIYAAGGLTMRVVAGADSCAKLLACERYPLGFLVGAAVWGSVLYPLGLAGLYGRPLAIGLTTALALASCFRLVESIEAAAVALSQFRSLFGTLASAALGRIQSLTADKKPSSAIIRLLSLIAQLFVPIAIVLLGIAFLAVKGLYPGGGHDYFEHYFPYYLRVVETGSTLPNDVWYHFYVSKGDGLYFIAMLLTDPLAPQLVTAGFILCGACIVYALLRRIARTGLLPWVGVSLYLAFYIYTPGLHFFMVRGGWGDLEKEHELTAVLMLGVVWCVIRLNDTSNNDRKLWILGLHASIVATILITLQLGFLIGLYLTGFMLWFALTRQWRKAAIPFFGGVTAAIAIAVVLAINYYLTGLVLDQAILFTWPIVNIERLARWGVLFEALTLHKHMLDLAAGAATWSRTVFWLLPCYLRLEIWWPLAMTGSIFAAHRISNTWTLRRTSQPLQRPPQTSIAPAIWILLWFAGSVTLTALFGGGRSQPVTFYRISSFSYAPTLCTCLALWHFGISESRAGTRGSLRTMLGGALTALLLTGVAIEGKVTEKFDEVESNISLVVGNAMALWSGRYSVADAYQNQQGWPGRMPWGGIYPGLEAAWRLLPPLTRVWSFHVYTYCMLPDCNFQDYLSFIFSPQWSTVYFGSPEAARAALQAENLNYFFFSKNMEIDDPIGHASLFSPDHIAHYLATRWTNGTDYLLTWSGPDTRSLDESFLAAYRDRTVKSSTYQQFDVEQWKKIANEIAGQKAAGQILHPFPLPWCSGLARCATIPWAIQEAK